MHQHLKLILLNHKDMQIGQDEKFSCPCCLYKNNRKERLIPHFYKNHIDDNTEFLILNQLSINQIFNNSLKDIINRNNVQPLVNEIVNYNKDDLDNILFLKINKQFKDYKSYSYFFMLNIVKFIANTRISIHKAEKCLNEIQNVFFTEQTIKIPSDTTIERYISAVEQTLDEIFKIILNNSNCKITRCIDESSGLLSLFYLFCDWLDEDRIIKINNKIDELINLQNKQQLSTENFKYLTKLQRAKDLGFELKYICAAVIPLCNLTTDELELNIKEIENKLNIKPYCTICDNGSLVLSFVNRNRSFLCNCMGHNLNLCYKYFIEKLYIKFESNISKIIRKLKHYWNTFKILLTVESVIPNFISTFLENENEEISINVEQLTDITTPPIPCMTRWQTIAEAGDYIFKNYNAIYSSIKFWQIDTKVDSSQTTFSDIIDILENEEFKEALNINSVFFTWLSKCYSEMRSYNFIDRLYRYIVEWKKRLEILDKQNYLYTVELARKSSLDEYDKLISFNLNSPEVLCAALLDNKYINEVASKLIHQPDNNLFGFSKNIILQLTNNEQLTLFNFPDAIKNWGYHFGTILIDNELVESSFSFLKEPPMKNRKNKNSYFKITHTPVEIWYNLLKSDFLEVFKEKLKNVNNLQSLSKDKRVRYIEDLKFIKSEKKRKEVRQRVIENEKVLKAILFLIKAFNALQDDEIELNTVKELSRNNLYSILNYLTENKYINENILNNNRTKSLTDVALIYEVKDVLDGIVNFLNEKLIPYFSMFCRENQHDIRDQADVLGIEINNLEETCSTQATNEYDDNFQQIDTQENRIMIQFERVNFN